MVVVCIMALMAAIVFPLYNMMLQRAERSAAIDNARAVITCINAHNRLAKSDSNLEPIYGTFSGEYVILSGVDSGGNNVADIDTILIFNDICENKLAQMTEEDYDIALEYITILTPSDEFSIKENYNHLN